MVEHVWVYTSGTQKLARIPLIGDIYLSNLQFINMKSAKTDKAKQFCLNKREGFYNDPWGQGNFSNLISGKTCIKHQGVMDF